MSASAPLQAYITKWHMVLEAEPFETHSSWLGYVRHGNTRALLKVYKPNSDETRSADILQHWGEAAVRVLEAAAEAILIERIIPATPLSSVVAKNDDEATSLWCDTVLRLHTKPPPSKWKTLSTFGRSFSKPFVESPVLSHKLFEQAKQQFIALNDTQSANQLLLHTDLHHGNVLFDERRGWLVIDPKGYVGELEFETAAFLQNPSAEYCTPNLIERRIKILAQRLRLNADRVLRWCFAHGVLSALWSLEEGVFDPVGGVKVARAALELLGTGRGI